MISVICESAYYMYLGIATYNDGIHVYSHHIVGRLGRLYDHVHPVKYDDTVIYLLLT